MSTSTDTTFDAFLRRLRRRLAEPLPGHAARRRMAPPHRHESDIADVRDKPCREAAVLVLLYPDGGAPTLVLTLRRADLKHHAGQVSFPGGRREPGETHLETALREAHEEIGLAPDDLEILGALSPLYIPPSNFCVYPYVAVFPRRPALTPQDVEVEAILHVPLDRLLDPANHHASPRVLFGETVSVPYFDVFGHRVWGATAMMLAELLALFDEGG